MLGARIVEGTESRWIETGEARIHVSDWGGAGDETIVFCHPTGFLGFVWLPIVRRLRKAGINARILTYDARGHGLSSKPDEGYGWENFGSDLAAVLEALGVSDALAVGHSAGATTALMVAEDVPGTFRRLLLIDPILIPPRPPGSETARRDNPMAAKTRTRRLVWPSREFLFESFRRRPPYDTWTEEALAAYVEYGTFDRPDAEVELLCPGRLEAKVYMASSEFDGFAVLEGAKTPLRIVAGSRSDAFYGERVDRARTMVGAEHLLIVEDATHFIPMERPDLTAELVIAELSARG